MEIKGPTQTYVQPTALTPDTASRAGGPERADHGSAQVAQDDALRHQTAAAPAASDPAQLLLGNSVWDSDSGSPRLLLEGAPGAISEVRDQPLPAAVDTSVAFVLHGSR